jgi:hypothetical protein
VDGNITEDLNLIIENLAIDGIDMTTKIPKISHYKGENGEIYTGVYNFMSFRGCMTLKFRENLLYADWLSSIL